MNTQEELDAMQLELDELESRRIEIDREISNLKKIIQLTNEINGEV